MPDQNLETLIDISDRLHRSQDFQIIVEQAIDAMIKYTGSPSVGIFIVNEEEKCVDIVHANGFTNTILDIVSRVPLSGSLTGLAVSRKEVIVSEDISIDDRVMPQAKAALIDNGFRSMVSVPLLYKQKVLGVLNLIFKREKPVSQSEHQTLLSIGKTIGLAMANARNVSQLKEEIAERKEVEKALRSSEEKYRFMVENVRDVIFIQDLDLNVEYVSPSMTQMFGYSLEEAYQIDLREVMTNESFSKAVENFKRELSIAKNNPQSDIPLMEYEYIRKDGSTFWGELRATFLRDAEGKIVSTYGILRDISDRKQAEEAHKDSERKYLSVIENSHTGIAIIDNNYKFSYVNSEFCSITGYSADELKGYDFRKVLDEDSKKMVTERYLRRQRGENVPKRYEFKILRKSGEKRDVEISSTVLRDSKDRTFTLAQLLDITEHKQAEQALQESEEKYRHLIEHSNDAIYLLYDGKFEIINEKFQNMFGVSLEEANHPDFNFMDLVSPKSRDLIIERQKRLANGEDISPRYEFTAISKEGKEVEVETSVTYVRYKDGIASQGVLRDVTDRKTLEDQLRQAQKMEAIGKLAGGVAHDFNNLLTVINGYTNLLQGKLKPEDVGYREIRQINKAGERAATLTDQLLAFSRRQVIKPEIINLNAVVSDAEKMLKRLIGENIDLVTRLEPNLGNVKADRGQVDQILMNLIVNSRDAMPEGGKMTIETENVEMDENYVRQHVAAEPGDYVMLAVSDTGEGMDEKIRSQIFEPFFTTKNRGKGTGLGLSTVFGIIKQNGGFIYCYSEPQKGTTFKIYLPQITEKIEDKDEEFREEFSEGNEVVLLAEDDEDVRILASHILNEQGYKVLEAKNGEEALSISENENGNIELVLTDVIMPGITGKELAEQLVSTHPNLKVIYFSGYTDDAIVRHGVLEEGIHFIQKPFTASALLNKVRQVLDSN